MSGGDSLIERPLTDLLRGLRDREFSSRELMEATLRRIDETRGTINAVSYVADGEVLLCAADAADARLARGEGRALEGIPLGIKDLFENVAGMPTSNGSALFKDLPAPRDDVHIARLRNAGAIPTARTNVPEFAIEPVTMNDTFGVTRNPWNLDLTPSASSGGSAAAIAAAILPLVTANDGGGSIRLPASMTGTFGLKPSFGRVPMGPTRIWDTAGVGVTGTITTTVRDTALYLDVVSGPSGHDAFSLPRFDGRYEDAAARPVGQLRVGFLPDFGHVTVQRDIAAVVARAATRIEALGHVVDTVQSGPPAGLDIDWVHITASALATDLEGTVANWNEAPAILVGIRDLARNVTPAHWEAIQGRRALTRDWSAALFERYDVLISPVTPFDPAPAAGPLQTEYRGVPLGDGIIDMPFTVPFNLTGHPAASVPVGFSDAGLPVGLQIVAPHHCDDLVLRLSLAIENAHPWPRYASPDHAKADAFV